MPALAAELRAFSSLLSLPSQAQSVIKAFHRQGIGFADVVNTARFFLSRLESLFAAQKVFQIFRGRAGLVRFASQRRDCVIYSVPLLLLSINPTDSPRHASRLWRSLFLVKVCARAGKTVISRFNLCASDSCRALRACPLWHLPSVSASAVADAKTVVKHHRPKRTDGRFSVCAGITVVPRPECVSFDVIYWMVYSSARILSGPSELPLSLRLIIYKDTLYFSFFGILVFLLNV